MTGSAIRQRRVGGDCSISAFHYRPAIIRARRQDVLVVYLFSGGVLTQACAFGGIEGANQCLLQMAGNFMVGPMPRIQ